MLAVRRRHKVGAGSRYIFFGCGGQQRYECIQAAVSDGTEGRRSEFDFLGVTECVKHTPHGRIRSDEDPPVETGRFWLQTPVRGLRSRPIMASDRKGHC